MTNGQQQQTGLETPAVDPHMSPPNEQTYAPPPETAGRRGVRREDYYQDDPRRKSPGLAMFLSLMPGLGQVYVGYYQQGFITVLIVASLIALLDAGVGDLQPLAGIFLAFFWLFNLIDAGRRAAFYNQKLAGVDPMTLPEDVAFSGTRGSLVGGVLLVVFGILFFAHTKFDVSLRWIEDWWPIALIGIGAYLIYRHVMEWQGREDRA